MKMKVEVGIMNLHALETSKIVCKQPENLERPGKDFSAQCSEGISLALTKIWDFQAPEQ